MSRTQIAEAERGLPGGTAPSFVNSYASLPERFFALPADNSVASSRLIRANAPLARELGIDPAWLSGPDGLAMLAGNRFPETARPVAMAYAGHQFGNFVPQLGDGRALLVGEVRDTTGRLRDIQLKGSGPTRFSRGGDGRAAIGPVLREYLVSEAMAALGIPTTRSLAAVLTGEMVYRETLLPGAVLARVAASHIRIGTFQYFAALGDEEALRTLADHAIERHYPDLRDTSESYLAFLDAVIAAQASLVAQWMLVGFIHGVMNTDNMTVSGETIDYGPCAFMDAYSPGMVFSSIDARGRYAYSSQPRIAVWNLARLAETLLPLLDRDEQAAVAKAETALGRFQKAYETAFHAGLRRKTGLMTEADEDLRLIGDLLVAMAENQADFTLTFRALCDDAGAEPGSGSARALFADPAAFDRWHAEWRARLAREPNRADERRRTMLSANPKYIPRNHRIEAAIVAAQPGDFVEFERLLHVVTRPFDEQPGNEAYAQAPEPHERVLRTFCGT